jgi:hypothetical protein
LTVQGTIVTVIPRTVLMGLPLLHHSRPRPLLAILLLLLAAVSGCAGAPVQEMSNARQAVRAAEHAGAAQTAPELMAESKALLKQAESNLRHGEYRAARDEAELARSKAVEARSIAEAAKQAPGTP